MQSVELLPVEIGTENKYYLRIKARNTGKKWCIRYIRKVTYDDTKINGWKYRTEIQCWGATLETVSVKMLRRLREFGYLKE